MLEDQEKSKQKLETLAEKIREQNLIHELVMMHELFLIHEGKLRKQVEQIPTLKKTIWNLKKENQLLQQKYLIIQQETTNKSKQNIN